MNNFICTTCIKDTYLKTEILKPKLNQAQCCLCLKAGEKFVTPIELGEAIENSLYERFILVENTDYDPRHKSIAEIIEEFLNIDIKPIQEEIEETIIKIGKKSRSNFWKKESLYYDFEEDQDCYEYEEKWNFVETEFKTRRFFHPTAKHFFDDLFSTIDTKTVWLRKQGQHKVVKFWPTNETIYRARVCHGEDHIEKIKAAPEKELNVPPKEFAKQNRMSAEDVCVFYGALDEITCRHEIDSLLTKTVASITWKTKKELRLLDLTLFDKVRELTISCFHPNYKKEIEKVFFLRKLSTLISKPICKTSGTNVLISEYLITQAMAEYLAYECIEPFEGILYKSAQREGGTNIALFSKNSDNFPLEYLKDSLKFS